MSIRQRERDGEAVIHFILVLVLVLSEAVLVLVISEAVLVISDMIT